MLLFINHNLTIKVKSFVWSSIVSSFSFAKSLSTCLCVRTVIDRRYRYLIGIITLWMRFNFVFDKHSFFVDTRHKSLIFFE